MTVNDAPMRKPEVPLRLVEFRPPRLEHGQQHSISITLDVRGECKTDTAVTDMDIIYAIVGVFRKLIELPHEVRLDELPSIRENPGETTITGRLVADGRNIVIAVKEADPTRARIAFVLCGFSQIMSRRC